MVAPMAIKDQEPPDTTRILSILMEVMDPLGTNLICSPAVVTDSDSPVIWKASLVPFGLVKLCSKNNKWWYSLAFCINCFNCSNPLPVSRLYCPWSAFPF